MTPTRQSKILFISQAHLRPGMNLTKLEAIFADHDLNEVEDWERVSDRELDQMIEYVNNQKAG